jgi:DNA-binding NarL/FixJ family response regulator
MFHHAEMTISTPGSPSMPQYEQQDVTPSPAALRSRILVIDDGDSVRDIIGIFLENAGFEVCGEAADGVEGIEQAKKLKPDLVVLDLAMPRMNGVETALVLSKTMPTLPVIILTMYQDMLGSSLASAIGIKAVIDKTDGLDKLIACVHSLLKIGSASESAQS